MILERLVIENFRQFKGRQEIVFSDLRDRNVTIVHAENGFGKTTLLKALLWVLYGKDGLKDDFEKPDSILHEGLAYRAEDPSAVAATVELTFKHDNDRYILTRQLSLAQQRLDAGKTSLSLVVMKDGQTFSRERPQQRIQAIVPDGISGFLFFNGERINYLAEERNSAQVTEAIHQMLGLKLLRTTIDDLRHQNVRGKLRSEQKESTSEEKRELIERLAGLETEATKLAGERTQTQGNLSAIAAELETVDAKLAANQKAHELQNKRIRLTKERDELIGRRDEVARRLAKLIADDGYTLFTSGLIKRGQEIVARLRSEGKIPARVLNTFLQELIDSGKCICKRHLGDGTPEREAVESLLTIAGDQDFNNAVGALDHAIGLIEGLIGTTQTQLQQLNTERLELLRDIRERDEEIEEIHQQLGGKDDEEVQQLEEKRKSLQLERDAQNSALGRIDGQIEATKEAISALENQIRQIADKEEAAAKAQRRVDAVEDCAEILDNILKAETEDLRPLLNDEIDSHFRKIMAKDYWAELTENYTLRIRKRVAGSDGDETEIDAALSTGERTVTSLVFIASLVALAKRRSEIPTILRDLAGSAYPVVIDSPFGSLSIFRDGVARNIPELAPQVLLLVSPEQYNGQVERALNETGRVGKRYYLAYHGPTMPERANPELVVNGQAIQQYFPGKNEEYTAIKELEL
ncbi:AAA family ATPase [Thauera linaloolentis]|uniref:SMC domain-containing protein n=1 Tax=Thauera linaloolentis (strain DSM 12138 / JCM 21573 / CCUG 41526 / CIP 105981 / IAM 15112 / NBRC 102519 / 47Lol) TaxID=1123367 RepID=N6Y2M7_THAL4|nr:AAA family ATPase [Thauera linaloolentis]ENO88421.1 SMC domain-containing protein [Thauera linaloolentis 47Lol = DSM 12138]MCM8566470.1 AAA family ATPase [Thauera linaloolentis]